MKKKKKQKWIEAILELKTDLIGIIDWLMRISFFRMCSQDVMVVGEPSLMGGEFGDEDERLITRLENTQYDASNSMDHDNHGGFSHDSPITGGPNSWNVDRKSICI